MYRLLPTHEAKNITVEKKNKTKLRLGKVIKYLAQGFINGNPASFESTSEFKFFQ